MDKLIKLIRTHEGEMPYIYNDATGERVTIPNGKLTGGIGHNFDDKPLTNTQMMAILVEDIEYFKKRLASSILFFNDLDEVRQAVLVDTAFNVGVVGLLEFVNTLKLMREKDFKNASTEILNSAAAKKLPGRYKNLSDMLLTGKWPAFCEE